jgi:hypothetical protein
VFFMNIAGVLHFIESLWPLLGTVRQNGLIALVLTLLTAVRYDYILLK